MLFYEQGKDEKSLYRLCFAFLLRKRSLFFSVFDLRKTKKLEKAGREVRNKKVLPIQL